MATLQEYQTALAFRDVMKGIISDQIEEDVGTYRYATVQSVDYFNRKAVVVYPDNSTQTVNMGSREPATTGQVVRIAGRLGDRYVDDVMGAIAIPANSFFKSRDDVDNGAQMQWDAAGSWPNWQATVFQNYMTFQTVTGGVASSSLKLRSDGAVVIDADSKRDSSTGVANSPPYSLSFGGITTSGEMIRSNRVTGATNTIVDNKYGLDFLTNYLVRLQVFNNGIVDIPGLVGLGTAYKYNSAQRIIPQINTSISVGQDGGTQTQTTNASGIAAYTHALGVAPNYINVTSADTSSSQLLLTSITSTGFSVHFWGSTGVSQNSVSVTIRFMAGG